LSKNGIIYDNTVDTRIVVGFHQGGFDIDGIFDGAQFIPESVISTGFSSPFGVLFGSGVLVGQDTDQ
jgi:hypothetical protein